METQELFLLEREKNRLLIDFTRCSNPTYKEFIWEEIMLISDVLASRK